MFGRKRKQQRNLGKRAHYKYKTNQELLSFGKFVTEMLIFRSSRSQLFFKIGALKNNAILELLFNKVIGLFYGTPTVAAFGL